MNILDMVQRGGKAPEAGFGVAKELAQSEYAKIERKDLLEDFRVTAMVLTENEVTAVPLEQCSFDTLQHMYIELRTSKIPALVQYKMRDESHYNSVPCTLDTTPYFMPYV